MFGTFRKHQKWIWIAAMAFVIPSFVVFFSPDIGRSGGGGKVDVGSIDGKPVSVEEYRAAAAEVELRYRMFQGQWPDRIEDLKGEILSRVLQLRQLKAMNIQPSDDTLVSLVQLNFRDRERQQYDPAQYQAFLQEAARKGIPEDGVLDFLRHELGRQYLMNVYGLGGQLLPPRAAEEAWRANNEQYVTEAVFFHSTNFTSKVQVTTNDLEQFYQNRRSDYEIKSKVEVHYVEFEALGHLADAAREMAKITDLDARLEQIYQQQGTNSFTGKDGRVLSPEAAKAKIKEDNLKAGALMGARREALKFASQLYDEKVKTAAAFLALAATNQFKVKTTEPFTAVDGPSELKVRFDFAQQAFSLNETNQVTYKPVVGEEAVYVMAFKERHAARLPPLDTVRADVEKDYRQDQARRLMAKAGQEFYEKLTNSIASGKTFAEVARAEKHEVVQFPPMSRSSRKLDEVAKHVSVGSFQRAALEVEVGKTSGYVDAFDTGFIVHMVERKPAPAGDMKAELADYLDNLRSFYQGQNFSAWVAQQNQHIQLPPEKQDSGKSR